MADVVLQYKRAATKDTSGLPLSEGRVFFRDGDQRQEETVFYNAGFVMMLRYFSDALCCYPEAQAVVERTDRAGLFPMTLDAQLTAQLRQDPEMAAASMQYTAAPVVHRPQAALPPVLLVGHETLADAFGDVLYCRARNRLRTEVECPACGRWQSAVPSFHCAACAFAVEITYMHDFRWGCVRTEDLLAAQPAPSRFFFPREWNEGRNWIGYTDLKRMYEKYMQEKSAS